MEWYISTSNQNLLWDTIHRVPFVSSIPLSIRETTFRNIVEYYYGGIRNNQNLDLSQKKEMNRRTISDFLSTIQTQSNIQSVSRTITSNIELNPINQMINQMINNNSHKMVETKQEKSQREFTERQQMYEQMTAKPDIPSSDIFREKVNVDDDAIQNMDDLIKKYQIEREKDMQLLSPLITEDMNQSRTKVSFANDPIIIPSIVVLEEAVLQNVEELNSPIDSSIFDEKSRENMFQEINRKLSQCIEICQDISLNQTYDFSSFSILQEKIYSTQSSLEKYLREQKYGIK